MVGKAVTQICEEAGDRVSALDRQHLDITDFQQTRQALESLRPDAVINCAAWTDVDGCERDRVKARQVNAIGPENLARAAEQVNAGLVTISTDYVFDGLKDGFYSQQDTPNPESVYAQAKLEGEKRAQLANTRCMVVRTGFIFGKSGRNFLSTVIDRARNGERVKAIRDSWGTPTYAVDLAVQLRNLALLNRPGVYHIVNSGKGASYEEFTRVVLEAAGLGDAEVEAISVESLRRPAPRPRNSRLRCLISLEAGLPPMRSWQVAVRDFAFSLAKP
jgi:dTDP-4-dehydrorhamnose reductase